MLNFISDWCPAGQQGNDTLQDCEPCPEGTYKEEAGLGMCLSCGDRYTTMTDGATNKTRDCVRKFTSQRKGIFVACCI